MSVGRIGVAQDFSVCPLTCPTKEVRRPGGTTSMLAQVSLVDYRGTEVFDKYVAPTMPVTDYRTSTTGLTQERLHSGDVWSFDRIQREVANLIKGRVLVGHCIWNDLSVLGIPHPAVLTRDVALYQPFRVALNSQQIIGLQTLAWQFMRRNCQVNQINPLENARAALDLYRSRAEEWEHAIANGNWPCSLPPSTFSRCYM